MEQEDQPGALIRDLEQRLLRPDVRSSPEQVADLLADDFVEIGSSGAVFSKQEIIEGLQAERPQQRSAEAFVVRALADDVVLVTYRTVRLGRNADEEFHALRSSIWKHVDGRWRMVFHQGTPTRRAVG